MGLNRLKGKAGTISQKIARENEIRIKKALKIMEEIDLAMKQAD